MHSTKLRFYVGDMDGRVCLLQPYTVSGGDSLEVLDIYKQATGSRYGSVDDGNSASSLSFLALQVYLPLQVQLVSAMPQALPYHNH